MKQILEKVIQTHVDNGNRPYYSLDNTNNEHNFRLHRKAIKSYTIENMSEPPFSKPRGHAWFTLHIPNILIPVSTEKQQANIRTLNQLPLNGYLLALLLRGKSICRECLSLSVVYKPLIRSWQHE